MMNPQQLFARHAADANGTDVGRPRRLATSVTVKQPCPVSARSPAFRTAFAEYAQGALFP